MSRLRLGILNSSVIQPRLEAGFSVRNRIIRGGAAAGLMQMLLFGQLDLVAIGGAAGRCHDVDLNGGQDRIATAGTAISSRTWHFGLSRASGAVAYLEDFDRAVR